MLRERLVPALMWLAAGSIVPVAVLHFFGREEAHISNTVHFAAVGAGAFVSTLAALALTWAGTRRRDQRVVVVGSAFSVMAVLLLLHGLTKLDSWDAFEQASHDYERALALARSLADPELERILSRGHAIDRERRLRPIARARPGRGSIARHHRAAVRAPSTSGSGASTVDRIHRPIPVSRSVSVT